MSDKSSNPEEELRALDNALSEFFIEGSDEAIINETRDKGKNPEEVAQYVKSLLLGTLKTYNQRHLKEAELRYKSRIVELQRKRYHLPATPDGRRSLLKSILAKMPQLKLALTAQYRDFTSLADADIESSLKQLFELNVLGDSSNFDGEK